MNNTLLLSASLSILVSCPVMTADWTKTLAPLQTTINNQTVEQYMKLLSDRKIDTSSRLFAFKTMILKRFGTISPEEYVARQKAIEHILRHAKPTTEQQNLLKTRSVIMTSHHSLDILNDSNAHFNTLMNDKTFVAKTSALYDRNQKLRHDKKQHAKYEQKALEERQKLMHEKQKLVEEKQKLVATQEQLKNEFYVLTIEQFAKAIKPQD